MQQSCNFSKIVLTALSKWKILFFPTEIDVVEKGETSNRQLLKFRQIVILIFLFEI